MAAPANDSYGLPDIYHHSLLSRGKVFSWQNGCGGDKRNWAGWHGTLLVHYPDVSQEHLDWLKDVLMSIDPVKYGGESHEFKLLFMLAQFVQGREIELGKDPKRMQDLSGYRGMVLMYRDGLIALDCLPEKFEKVDWGDDPDVWLGFEDSWRKVKVPDGSDPFRVAVLDAKAAPISLKSSFFSGDAVLYERLEHVASICYHLQILREDEDIIIPTESVGQLFNKSEGPGRVFAGRLLDALRNAGLLRLTKGTYCHGRTCQEHAFCLDRLDLYTPPSTLTL